MTTLGIIVTVILLILFSIIINIFIGEDINFSNIIFGILPSILCVFMFWFIFLGVAGACSEDVYTNTTSKNVQIKSISPNSNTKGSFILGCGTIGTNDYYYFMKNTKYGYKVEKISIDGNVYIKDDANKIPTIETISKGTTTNFGKFFKLFIKVDTDTMYQHVATVFHLPKGSIVENYTVDISKF